MTEDKWSARTWHRRASKPVTIWMIIFIVCGVGHILIPNYRWVLIHLFTLGILSNAILVWSQHLTEKFVQQRLPDSARPKQLARIYIFNLGVIIVLAGQILIDAWSQHWILTLTGAAIISAMVAWHGFVLFTQWKSAANKLFRPVVAAYVFSALCLAVGAFFGGFLSLNPGNPQLLLAHIGANVGGFVGLAAAGSLTILFPAIWRSNGTNRYMNTSFILLAVGVLGTSIGSLMGFPQAGLVIYVVGWVLSLQQWLGTALRSRTPLTYPSVSVLLAVVWLVGALTYYTVQHFLTEEPALPTLALLVGFAAQLLIGVMSYLLPTTMGGGPAAVRAGLQKLNGMGLFRSTLINLGLLAWITTDISWLSVVISMLSLGALAVFPILMVRAVKAQRAVITGKAEGPPPQEYTPWGQVAAGIAIIAAICVLFLRA
ncbi:copper oxidase [Corynebacterium camporealensis]